MSLSVTKPATARLTSRSIGIGLVALIGSASSPMASERHGDQGTSRLSRAELIERVVRYYPQPHPEMRARISRALSDNDPEQFATHVGAGCADATSPSPPNPFD